MPCDEPTLHLTIGFHNDIGLGIVKWVGERLERDARFRQDIPRFGTLEAQRLYIQDLRSAVAEIWSDPALLEHFCRYADGSQSARCRLSLPWSATPLGLPTEMDYFIETVVPRGLTVYDVGTEDTVVVELAGNALKFPKQCAPLLRFLSERTSVTAREFFAEFRGTFSDDQISELLGDLVAHGVVMTRVSRINGYQPAGVLTAASVA